MKIKYLIGIDEVGRGPIAGPMAVCAVMIKKSFKLPKYITSKTDKGRSFVRKICLKDSKKLSYNQRLLWFKFAKKLEKEGKLKYAISFITPEKIDKVGISKSLRILIDKCLSKLEAKPGESLVLLDGGIKASEKFKNQKTIIKGDEKEPVISMASIIAKVLRDRRMTNYAKKFPFYGFEIHKGYGTEFHYKMVEKYGLSSVHRHF